jgi:RecA-family ATPase
MFIGRNRKETKLFTKENIRTYLVDGLIAHNSLNFITGPSSVGKTTVLYHLAKCIADNESWMNMKTDNGKVIVFDNEMGVYEFDQKMDKLDQKCLENIYHIEDQFIDVKYAIEIGAMFSYIENEVKNHNLKLVIIDSLSACCGNLDENSNTDMRTFMDFADKLSHICTTFVIHHKGKSDFSEFRGASIIKDRADNFFVMDKQGEIRISKNRSSNKGNQSISFDYVDDGEYIQLCSKKYELKEFEPKKDLSQIILENLEDGMNQTQLFEKMRSNGVRFVNEQVSKILKSSTKIEIRKGSNNASLYYLKS